MMKKVLIIAAHPDDEVLGCGGTVARLVREGAEVHTLILGQGITGRGGSEDADQTKKALARLVEDAKQANDALGVAQVYFKSIIDNRFDTLPLLDIVKIIEGVKNKIRPDTVFTHYAGDLNIDHQITYKAVITATRPVREESVKRLYSFEVLSSTEWNYPLSFSPDVFVDISRTIELKCQALCKYHSELRNFPHPRSVEAVQANAKIWGAKAGLQSAEAFKCVRVIM